ncbi:hypothetical protein D3C72_1677340 [compost metagenome]
MALACRERQDFRHLIGMMLEDALAQGLEQRGPGLDDELDFARALNFPLPAIDGGEPWQLIDAGGEVPGQQLLADEVGTGLVWTGAEHQNSVGHGMTGLV